jgi:hypothetical protein
MIQHSGKLIPLKNFSTMEVSRIAMMEHKIQALERSRANR